MSSSEKIKYIVDDDTVIELLKGDDGFFRDSHGTIFALRDGKSADEVDRCGIGFFSLPTDHVLTPICRSHDYMFTSPFYFSFHSRKEADEYLKKISLYGFPWTAKLFYSLARIFGGLFWRGK